MIKSKRLIIFGQKALARLVRGYFENDSPYVVAAFTADSDWIESRTVDGLPVIPYENLAELYTPGEVDVFVGASYGRMNATRAMLVERMRAAGWPLASYISSKAACWAKSIGDHVLISDMVAIQPMVEIGHNVLIGPNCTIGHDAVLGDNCFLAPNVVVGSGSRIGRNCVLGTMSMTATDADIGERCFIGSGCRLFTNAQDGSLFLEKGSLPQRFMTDALPPMLDRTLFGKA